MQKGHVRMKQFANENFPEDIQRIADRMNIDINAVPGYTVPPLPIPDGATAMDFVKTIRPELVKKCADLMYGELPPRCEEILFKKTDESDAFDGLGIRREIDIVCRNKGREAVIHVLLYLPKKRKGRAPVFVGLNFKGNHSVSNDPNVHIHPFERYPETKFARETDRRVGEEGRGIDAGRNSFEKVLEAGFASATACYMDICADRADMIGDGIYPLFYTKEQWNSPKRDFGAISAWAWGISRIIDCLETQPEIDMRRVVVHGHSRLGKTSLWAGANDRRISIVASNGSGTSGAKLCHRYYGENFEWVKLWNPHWLRASFYDYAGRDAEFPIDQHFLIAACAPRPVFISGGTMDIYADTIGEYEACREASPAWRLFGGKGIGEAAYPEAGNAVGDEIGFYMREGDHQMTPDVWDALIAFVKKHLN